MTRRACPAHAGGAWPENRCERRGLASRTAAPWLVARERYPRHAATAVAGADALSPYTRPGSRPGAPSVTRRLGRRDPAARVRGDGDPRGLRPGEAGGDPRGPTRR